MGRPRGGGPVHVVPGPGVRAGPCRPSSAAISNPADACLSRSRATKPTTPSSISRPSITTWCTSPSRPSATAISTCRTSSRDLPSGTGLGYATFALQDLTVEPVSGVGARVSVTVRNTSERAGKEVVQVYVRAPHGVGSGARELEAFAPVWLEPGAAARVELELDRARVPSLAGPAAAGPSRRAHTKYSSAHRAEIWYGRYRACRCD